MLDNVLWFAASPFICVGWIIIGAIAGAFARRIMGSSDKPFFQDLLLGIVGAVIGGWVLGFANIATPSGGITLVIVNLIVATITAALLIWIGRMIGVSRKSTKK